VYRAAPGAGGYTRNGLAGPTVGATMSILLVALVVGIVAGLATGGRPRYAAARPVRWTGALAAGAVLQLVPLAVDIAGAAGLACVLASYALLVAFAIVNIRLVGMPVVLVGLLLNGAVIAANQGMPVREDAIATVDRSGTPAEIRALDFEAKRHLEEPGDRFTVLGDAIPIRPLGVVVSFGDLILAVGLLDVVFRLLRPHVLPHRRERREPVDAGHTLALG
jgi:hypothetical protein